MVVTYAHDVLRALHTLGEGTAEVKVAQLEGHFGLLACVRWCPGLQGLGEATRPAASSDFKRCLLRLRAQAFDRERALLDNLGHRACAKVAKA